MKEETMKAALEAVLFALGDAVRLEKLASAIGQDPETTRELLGQLGQSYQKEDRGIRLIELDGSFQLCTKPELYGYLIQAELRPRKFALSDAAMETLSIVAYRQPVTKLEIEKIRGVKCDHAVNRLIEYGLIREVGRLDAPGRPILFGTTEEFLRNFGVQSLADLPTASPVQLEDFKAEAQEEARVQLPV